MADGHWACGYGGPSFLLAGIVIAMYITDTPIAPEWKTEIIRYLSSTVNADGGWGLHSAGHSTVFATALYYVNLRILGLEPSHPMVAKARDRLHALGTFAYFPVGYLREINDSCRRPDWYSSMGQDLVVTVEPV